MYGTLSLKIKVPCSTPLFFRDLAPLRFTPALCLGYLNAKRKRGLRQLQQYRKQRSDAHKFRNGKRALIAHSWRITPPKDTSKADFVCALRFNFHRPSAEIFINSVHYDILCMKRSAAPRELECGAVCAKGEMRPHFDSAFFVRHALFRYRSCTCRDRSL